MRRSFESQFAVRSSKPLKALAAIYQFQERGVTSSAFWSDILNGFRGIRSPGWVSPISMSREAPTAGNQRRRRNRRGQGGFSPSFPEPSGDPLRTHAEQNFILGSWAVSRN